MSSTSAFRVIPLIALLAAAQAAAQTPPTTPSGFASVRGTATDSIHGQPLIRALIVVEGTTRLGFTDAHGDFLIDSIPPGSHRLSVSHPVLDTLALVVMTNPLVMRPGETRTIDVATPSAAFVVSRRCPAGMLQRFGPAALMGQVIDADSLNAAIGSKVQLVYEETLLGFKGKPVVREAVVDSSGNYRICGLPTPIAGKLQVFKNGVSSGQVDVDVSGALGLRSLSIAAAQIATTSDSSGKTRTVAAGNSRLAGKVLTKAGRPIESARVSIEGYPAVTLTNAQGEFTLDSLPAGTQSVEVRKIGYASTDKAVELSPRAAASTEVVLDVAELAPMRIVAGAQSALDELGYTDRKNRGLGRYIDGEQISRNTRFSDALRMLPNLRISPGGNGRSVISDARNPAQGCVNFFVDNMQWREFNPGDIDDFVNPSEVRAIESYSASSVPAQFQVAGSTGCATVVVWTTRYLSRKIKK